MIWYFKVLGKYATFSGRARRKEYWMFFLFHIIIFLILSILGNAMHAKGILTGIYRLLVIIPIIAVGVRRMHDVGKSGWFFLIPIYNFILAVSLGEIGSNKYGRDPKELIR